MYWKSSIFDFCSSQDVVSRKYRYLGIGLTDFDFKTRFRNDIKFDSEVFNKKRWYESTIVVKKASKIGNLDYPIQVTCSSESMLFFLGFDQCTFQTKKPQLPNKTLPRRHAQFLFYFFFCTRISCFQNSHEWI
jgi:hypothetical protein